MDSRVGQLDLTVRAPEARWAELREQCEQFAKRVLARCDELLEERAPGRVVLLRELDMHWRLFENAFEREVEVTSFADEIAAAIDARARAAPSQPSPSDDIAVFDNEVVWRSAHLVASAKRVQPDSWYFAPLNAEGEAPGAVLQMENRSMAVAVVLHLARSGMLAAVLEGLAGSALVALSCVILGDFEESRVRHNDSPSSLVDLRRLAEKRLRLFATEIVPAASATPAADSDSSSRTTLTPGPGLGVVDLRGGKSGDGENVPSDGSSWLTRFGGLFYLLNPALELGVGEILWKACVHEGAVLSHAALAILGLSGADDVAPTLFGGVAPSTQIAPLSVDAHREISLALFENLVRTLARRGLAVLPEVTVTMIGGHELRLLVVAARGTDFVLLALPAGTPVAASAALSAFLDRWPLSAAMPRAAPAIAELDSSGRIIAEGGLPTPVLLTTDIPDLLTAAMIAQVGAAIAYVFAARVHKASAPDLWTQHLHVNALIRLEQGSLLFEVRTDDVDLDVRNAGLDANPGWVPWLKRDVQVTFVDGD